MGKTFSYTVLIDDKPPPEVVTRSITQIEIEREVNGASMIRLTLNTAVDAAGRGWVGIDDGTFGKFTKISVLTRTRLPFPRPLVTGYLVDIKPQRSSSPGRSQFEVVAMDAQVFLRSLEVTRCFPNMSDTQIAQQLFEEWGLRADVDDTSIRRDQHNTSTTQSQTDGSLLDELAQRNGFEFRIEPGAPRFPEYGHFHAPRLDAKAQGTLNVNLGSDTNVADSSVQDNRQSAAAMKVGTVDARTIEPVYASSRRTTERTLGADVFEEPTMETIIPTQGLTDPGELQRLVQVQVDDSNWAITASGSTSIPRYGDTIRVGEPINLRGAGQSDSGTYYVTAVTYMFTPRSMTQNFTLKRNDRKPIGDERFQNLDQLFV
jgi:hypothetical protein